MNPSFANLRFETMPQHDGSAHVEVRDRKYHYVGTERGSETFRKITKSRDELLYWLVSHVAGSVAHDFELKHRIRGRDFRRLLFAKQIEYLSAVKVEWAETKRHEFETILNEHP